MTDAPFTPLIVHERGEIAHVLAARRSALGYSCEAFDGHVGWADRYTAKLEQGHTPSGKLGFHFAFPSEFTPGGGIRCSGMAELWMVALGLRLVLVDEATAAAIGAIPAPPPSGRPGRDDKTALRHARRRITKGRFAPMPASNYEALDRTHVAAEAFRAAVVEHPHVASNPALKAQAEAVEAAMHALYQSIGMAA